MIPPVHVIDGPSDLKIYYRGAPFEEGPLPAFFYFALSGQESLSLDPFCQPVNFASQLPLRSFSFTLPFHGADYQRSQAMETWFKNLQEGNFWLENFLEKSMANIDFLVHSGWVDSKHIAVGGLSRGGFIALQLAARHPKIGFVVGHASLIELPMHKAFQSLRHSNALQPYRSEMLIPRLLEKKLLMLIGNHDVCVGTQQCCDFVTRLSEAMFLSGKRSPTIELYLFPSIGHQGHGTPPEVFQKGIIWLQQQWQM